MHLISKVNQLIDIIESRCKESCLRKESNTIINLDLNEKVSFTYHVDIGVMMFYDNVWYTDEKRVSLAKGVEIVCMREKLIELVSNSCVNLVELERMAFQLS